MDLQDSEEALNVVNSNLSRIKWRLRAVAKRRLETDILALCTRLRPVVMVDYGGKMPELQQHLCSLIHLCHKESSILQHLRVMVIEEMIYLIHVKGLGEHVLSSLSFHPKLHFVDLEVDPPKIVLQTEQNLVASQLVSIQRFFSSVFSTNGENKDLLSTVEFPKSEQKMGCVENSALVLDDLSCGNLIASQSAGLIDLSICMQDTQVTLPTLNGWLLGYPIVYLFSKDRVTDAVYNLTTKSLHIFQILVCRNQASSKDSRQEELMSFTVPFDLSMGGKNEPWAVEFLDHMQAKFEKCKQAWKSLQMEVNECYPQSIAL